MNTFYYKEAECSAGNLFKKDHVHIRLFTKEDENGDVYAIGKDFNKEEAKALRDYLNGFLEGC